MLKADFKTQTDSCDAAISFFLKNWMKRGKKHPNDIASHLEECARCREKFRNMKLIANIASVVAESSNR